MSGIINATGKHNGVEFKVLASSFACSNTSGFGCQGTCINQIGLVRIGNVQVIGGKIYGRPSSTFSFGVESGISLPPNSVPDIPDEVILWAVWEAVLEQYKAFGVLVFSDRINRGSSLSTGHDYSSYRWGPLMISTGAMGKWLQGRPDLGVCLATPVFNNPNYRALRKQDYDNNYGFCKLWVYFPKGRELYADEVLKYPENIPTKDKFIEEVWLKKEGARKTHLKEVYGD